MEERIRVEGPTRDLESLRQELHDRLGESVTVEPIYEAVPGELREPVAVALILAFASTASVAIRALGSLLERVMLHQERGEEFRILRERDERQISVGELTGDMVLRPRTIEVRQDELDRLAVDWVAAMCAEAEQSRAMARMFQGSLNFRFPAQAERGAEVWSDASVCAWMRGAYDRVPHLLYYLDPDPARGAVALLCASLLGSEGLLLVGDGGSRVASPTDALRLVSRYLLAAAIFAEEQAEDWRDVVEPLVATLDPGFAVGVMRIVESVLAMETGLADPVS